MRTLSLAIVLVTASLATADGLASPVSGPEREPPLQSEWEIVELTDAGCAFDTPYRAFFRPRPQTSTLLVYFQGGGACWSWVSCSGMFDHAVEEDELTDYGGVFDFDNPDNPFRDHAVLVIPCCSGDVHVGDTTGYYTDDPDAQPVQHRGRNNTNLALDWLAGQLENVERIVVSGTSAGSYGAVYHTPNVASRYPSATVVAIGDSGVPLLDNYPEILDTWGATDLSLESWFERAAAEPNVESVSLITSDNDAVQFAFYLISGSPEWRAATYELLNHLEASVESFRSFVVDGRDHGLLNTSRFYTYASDGERLTDWIGDLIEGQSVLSRRCDGCVD